MLSAREERNDSAIHIDVSGDSSVGIDGEVVQRDGTSVFEGQVVDSGHDGDLET